MMEETSYTLCTIHTHGGGELYTLHYTHTWRSRAIHSALYTHMEETSYTLCTTHTHGGAELYTLHYIHTHGGAELYTLHYTHTYMEEPSYTLCTIHTHGGAELGMCRSWSRGGCRGDGRGSGPSPTSRLPHQIPRC
jgi:hypothetical protein